MPTLNIYIATTCGYVDDVDGEFRKVDCCRWLKVKWSTVHVKHRAWSVIKISKSTRLV